MDMMQGLINANAPIGQQDVMGGFLQGQKASTDIANTQQDLRTKKYQQDLTEKLQKAIEEAYDPATGQPDYDKLADSGHKYGISAQAMKMAADHLKNNWDTIASVAQNKQTAGLMAGTGWNKPRSQKPVQDNRGGLAAPAPNVTTEDQTNQTQQPVGAFKQVPELTEAQKALTGADEYTDSKIGATNEMIGGLNAAVAQSGNPTGAPIPTRPQVTSPAINPLTGEQVGVVGDSWTRRPAGGAKVMDLGTGRITAEAPAREGHTMLQNLQNMEVRSPSEMAGALTGSGVEGGLPPIPAPRNAEGVDTVTNPQADIQGNTQTWLRNHAYNSGDYDTDYNQALNDVASAEMAKMPLMPIPTGDYKKDTEARNAYRNEVQKVQGEALQAKLKLRDDIAKGNWEAASKTLESLKGTLKVGNEVYRARDDAARATALALMPVKSEIPQFEKDLKNVKTTDQVGLQTMLARGARLYAGAMNPGAQVSEGSLAEVGRQIFGEHGVDLKVLGAQAAAAYMGAQKGHGFKAVGEVLASYASKFDGGTIKQRLIEMTHGAKNAIETTLGSALVGYGKQPEKKAPQTHEPETTESPKQPWTKKKVGAKKDEAPKSTKRKALF